VLTTAAVLGVVYAGGKIIESRRAWEETDAAIARNAKPEKRQGITSEDGKPTIRAFKHIPITMLRTSVDMKDENPRTLTASSSGTRRGKSRSGKSSN
jgi:hypothetical protein